MKKLTKKMFNEAKDAFSAWAFLFPGTGAVALRLNGTKRCPVVEIYEQASYDSTSEDWDFQQMGHALSLEEFFELFEEIPREIVGHNDFGNVAVIRRDGNGYRLNVNGVSIRKRSMLLAVREMAAMGYR